MRRTGAAAARPALPKAAWAVVAALHLLPFATRPALVGGDEPHYALMAHSIAVDRDLELGDDYARVEAGSAAAGEKRAGEALERHLRPAGADEVFTHPLGLPLLAAPLVALQQAIAPGSPPDLPFGLLTLAVTGAGLVAGLRLLGLLTGDPRRGALAGLAIYLSSPLWFYSRTFFTEPYLWSFTVLGVAALAARRPGLAGLPLALALAMKETAVLLVVPVLLAAWRLRGSRAAARAAAGPALYLLAFVAKNLAVYGRPLVPFQAFQLGEPLAGATGLLVDAERGLVWFAPLALVAVAGWGRRGAAVPAAVRWAALAAFTALFALTAAWIDWRGGSSYGPRLIVPALAALAVPLAAWWPAAGAGRRAERLALGVLFALGFAVAWMAALTPFDAFWGASPWALAAERPEALVSGLLAGTGLAVWAGRLERPPGGARL